MSGSRLPFEQRLKRALASPDLRIALERSLSQLRDRRARALAEIDFPTLRADLTARRTETVDQLPDLVERFTTEARAAGAQVHLAADAAEARAIIGGIAREHGVRLAIEAESPVIEEIELDPYLETIGVVPIGTALASWICRRAGDAALQSASPQEERRREQSAALLNLLLGERLDPDDGDRVFQAARLRLREQLIAGMTITGANAAIAESGALGVVEETDEERLAAALPPIQVALLGIEAIVASRDDAAAVLGLLESGGTSGQPPRCVSFISGALGGDGARGARQLHVVLLDNGRTGMLADGEFREALRCIGCAACSQVCPPFAVVGEQAFGHIYSGPIGLVKTAWHHGVEAASGPQSLCISCNACEPVCPVAIPLPRLILGLREQATKGKAQPIGVRAGLAALYGGGALAPAGRLFQRPLRRGSGFIGGPMLPGGEWRRLPRVPGKSFTERLARREREGAVLARRQAPLGRTGAAGLRVAYFPGCLTDRFYPEMGEAAVRLLQAAGAEVVVPPRTGCCGLPAYDSGDRERAFTLAKATIATLRPARVDYVVSSSPSCAVCISQDYAHILREDSGWQSRAAELGPRVLDLTAFMDRIARFPPGSLRARERQATYHDACASYNCLGLSVEGRRLVRDAAGGEIVEMAEPSACCGFGGAGSFEHPEVAKRITEKKLTQIDHTGAALVLTDNPGCILHLRGALHARGSSVRVQHLAEYLADALAAGKG